MMLKTKQKLAINWVDTYKDIPDSLWHACFPPPLEGKWWYETLETSGLDAQFRFIYGILQDGAQPIGIVPTFLMEVPMELVVPSEVMAVLKVAGKLVPGLLYQKTLFVGSACADEGTIGLLPEYSLSDMIPSIQAALDQQAKKYRVPMLVWKDFPNSQMREMESALTSAGLFKLASYPGTILALTPDGMNGYWSRLKGSRRFNLRKKLRKSHERGKLEVSVVQRPNQEILDEIFGLFWQTYEKGETKFEKLTPQFFSLIAQKDVSWFVLLRDPKTQKLVAFMLCFRIGDRIINKFIGLDYSYTGDWYLYFRLWEAALNWVVEDGASELQSGQTGYRAKIDVGHDLVPLTNFCKHTNPIVHAIYKKVGSTISWSTLDPNLAEFLKAHPDSDLSS